MMAQWFVPRGFTNPVCDLDVRVGGSLRVVMRGPDGNEYPMKGEFREVTPPERLVFTNIATDQDGKHLLEGETTVILSESNGKTTLTLQTHAIGLVPIASQMLAGMEAGWNSRASTSWQSCSSDQPPDNEGQQDRDHPQCERGPTVATCLRRTDRRHSLGR